MKQKKGIDELIILIRGGGELASGVAHRLQRSHFKICMTEISHPLAVRREVAFSEAIYEDEKEVEGVWAKLISKSEDIESLWRKGNIPILVDPDAKKTRKFLKPDVLVDAIIAKKNLGDQRCTFGHWSWPWLYGRRRCPYRGRNEPGEWFGQDDPEWDSRT
ncbi:MAG: family selenium-dependent molybdenum hydroxylase system protein [Deltaproteobacteria bacterium]|nr:family selenium-dependent molybdenum hydroxylase system protein [Deltaproteobacteria bacterium]